MNKGVGIELNNVDVWFGEDNERVDAVIDASFSVPLGGSFGLVGESGSGKSVSALSIMQLLPYPQAFHPSGSIIYDGQQLMNADEKQLRKVRGNDISIILGNKHSASWKKSQYHLFSFSFVVDKFS